MEVGQRIHCILHGGTDGVIEAIHGIGVTGGNAIVDVLWDDGTQSRSVPESLILRSVQWRLYPEVWPEADVLSARRRVDEETARRKAEAEAKEREMARACEALRKANPSLLTAEAEPLDNKRAVANLRKLLKLTWPKVKFSVRQSHGSVRIGWRDGPTVSQVDAIAGKFEAGHFDGMTDSYEYRDSAWTRMFGSVTYVNTSREHSDVLLSQMVTDLWAHLPNLQGVDKPDVTDSRYGWNPQTPVPGLSGVMAEELVSCLASNFDMTAEEYRAPKVAWGRLTFIVSTVMEEQLKKAA